MAVVGWIVLGLMTGLLVGGFRQRAGRGALAGRAVLGMAGAVGAGLVATAAGVGSIEDFFHAGAWLIAVGGALLAVVGFDLASRSRGREASAGTPSQYRPRPTAPESESLDRNW